MNLKYIFTGFHEQKRIQVPRAIISSLLAALVDYGVMVVLVEVFEVAPLTAGTAGMIAGLVSIYFAGRFWIYPQVTGAKAAGIEILWFIILSLIGAGIHTVVLAFGLDTLHIHYLIAKSFAATLMFSWNFSSRKVANRIIRNRQKLQEVQDAEH